MRSFYHILLTLATLLHHFAREEISYNFHCSSFFQKCGKCVCGIACSDEVIYEENFFSRYSRGKVREKRILSSHARPLGSRATRLVTGEHFFLKWTEYLTLSRSVIGDENFRMIWSTKNPVSQAHWWIDNTVWLVDIFSLHRGKKLPKVDTVDMIVDKLETMYPSSHFGSI